MWLQAYSSDQANTQGQSYFPSVYFAGGLTLLNDLQFPKLILLFHAFGFLPKLLLLPRMPHLPLLPCLASLVNTNPFFNTQHTCHLVPPRADQPFLPPAPTVLYTDFYQPADNLLLHYKLQHICRVVLPLCFLQGQEQGFIYLWVPRTWNTRGDRNICWIGRILISIYKWGNWA